MVEFSIFEKLDDLNAHFRKYGNKDGYLLGTITIFFYNFFLSRFRPKVTTWSLQQRLRPSRLVRPHRDRGRRELLLPGWLMQLMLPRSSQIFPDSKKTRTGSPGAAFALSKRTFDPTGSGLGFFPYAGNLVMWWTHGGRCLSKIRWFSLFKTRWYRMFQPCLMTGYRTIKSTLIISICWDIPSVFHDVPIEHSHVCGLTSITSITPLCLLAQWPIFVGANLVKPTAHQVVLGGGLPCGGGAWEPCSAKWFWRNSVVSPKFPEVSPGCRFPPGFPRFPHRLISDWCPPKSVVSPLSIRESDWGSFRMIFWLMYTHTHSHMSHIYCIYIYSY